MTQIDKMVFDTAYELWSMRRPQMETRRRLKRYTYGDQWGDVVTTRSGERMVESDLILSTGRRPITNNLIRRLVKTLIGRFRELSEREGWYETTGGETDDIMELKELDSRLLEEFLISGMAIQRIGDDNPLSVTPVKVENVNPERFFCNDFRDPRGLDIDIVGMLHDMSPAETMLRFGGKDGERRETVMRALGSQDTTTMPLTTGSADFYVGARGRQRIIEVWTREYGMSGEISWQCRWYAPTGEMLSSYVSPWRHGQHPFAVKFYPLTDGEIHSFVEDIVDQQRYINRLIVLIDRIMSTSAKGVLLFPVNQKPQNFSWHDIARRWASPDGIIPITGMSDDMPQQIQGSGGDMNAYRLLEMELRLFEQTSGVGSALIGGSNSGREASGADMYAAQVENATIALADIFETFRSIIRQRRGKLINN